MVVGCGTCAGRKARLAASNIKYEWMSEDGMETRLYEKEIEAKAKVSFVGGTYRLKAVASEGG